MLYHIGYHIVLSRQTLMSPSSPEKSVENSDEFLNKEHRKPSLRDNTAQKCTTLSKKSSTS